VVGAGLKLQVGSDQSRLACFMPADMADIPPQSRSELMDSGTQGDNTYIVHRGKVTAPGAISRMRKRRGMMIKHHAAQSAHLPLQGCSHLWSRVSPLL
jgi:hypothetical protein